MQIMKVTYVSYCSEWWENEIYRITTSYKLDDANLFGHMVHNDSLVLYQDIPNRLW